MSLDSIKKVGVAGAGTMGAGIAQVSALAGYEVILFDVNADTLKNASKKISKNLEKGIEIGKLNNEEVNKAKELIVFTDDIKKVKADLIIEAIIEDVKIKKELYNQLEKQNSDDCIIATNTSSIPVTQLMSDLNRKSNFLGLHFFNPAHIMKLVEVVEGIDTGKETIKTGLDWVNKIGKTPALVKDSPGFIVNRVARQFYTESLRTVEERGAEIEQLDKLIEGLGFKMGPFRLMDLIGVETNHKVTTTMFDQFFQEARFRPSRLQQQYVDAGKHGRKTGEGFYNYE